jgi:truncated hemoglobin YjbI
VPSSGYGMTHVLIGIAVERRHEAAKYILERAQTAMTHGLFVEWLECFLAAWEETNDPFAAASAGGEEWDF